MSNTNNNMQTQTSSALYNDTVTSCLVSKIKKSNDFKRREPTFKRTFSKDMDLIEKHLTKERLYEIDCETALTKLRTMFENTFNSELREQSSGTESEMQDESSTSWNDTNVDDADIRPIYDEEPMAE
nr:hypothetical protein [Tanacetum cinerariifolium]